MVLCWGAGGGGGSALKIPSNDKLFTELSERISSPDGAPCRHITKLTGHSLYTLYNNPIPTTDGTKGLVTNYGEGRGYKTGGGAREVLPLRKGGGRKSFSHAEGGAQKVLG